MGIKKIGIFLLLFGTKLSLNAQTLPVGLLDNFEDNLRRQQLLGLDTVKSSFLIRPLQFSGRADLILDSQSGVSVEDFRKQIPTSFGNKISLYLLPVTLQQQYNGHHPYGWNDGSMVQAKGYQMLVSTGVFLKAGPLSIQLKPEYVYAENAPFRQTQDADNNDEFKRGYARYINRIDLPERYGRSAYSRMNLGQSSIRLTFDPVSLGISNENLWWGPGVRNSLLMSNTAPGFTHISLNTTKPVSTPIGAFEAQIIAGKLKYSGVPKIEGTLYTNKPDDWRYLAAAIITYQPKWLPGFSVGMDRAAIVYRKDMGSSFSDYFPFFGSLDKVGLGGDEDSRKRDQYTTFFGRWVMPESHAEVYFQWGKNDSPYDFRDGYVQADHSRAYIAGVRKLVPLAKEDEFIQVGIEATQLEGARTGNFREQPVWYTHHQVNSGYTNLGQVVGAGIGPGSNLQSLDVSWVKGLKRIGLQVERYVHNNDLYYSAVKDLRRNWVDFSIAGKFDWDFGRFVLNSELNYIKSLNYQYEFDAGDGGFFDWDKQDANNLHLRVGILYKW